MADDTIPGAGTPPPPAAPAPADLAPVPRPAKGKKPPADAPPQGDGETAAEAGAEARIERLVVLEPIRMGSVSYGIGEEIDAPVEVVEELLAIGAAKRPGATEAAAAGEMPAKPPARDKTRLRGLEPFAYEGRTYGVGEVFDVPTDAVDELVTLRVAELVPTGPQ